MALMYGPLGLWAFIGCLFVAAYFARRFGVLGRLIDVPFIRSLLEPFILASALRVLSACGTAGMLWPDALNSSAEACGNQVIAGRLRRAAEDLRHDRLPDLPAAIATITNNRFTQEQVAVGNTAGELESRLHKAAIWHSDTFQTRSKWTARDPWHTLWWRDALRRIPDYYQCIWVFILAYCKLKRERLILRLFSLL